MRMINHKILSVSITFSVVIILILTGPAQAFILNLEIIEKQVFKGEKINLIVSVEEELGENIKDIDRAGFILNGPEYAECLFDSDGNIISGCKGITITKISTNQSYGYGYGFQQKIKYNIKLDTRDYKTGIYETETKIFLSEEIISKRGENIEIKSEVIEFARCSVRGKNGGLIVESTDFGNNNQINFYVSNKNAKIGGGYLISQKDRDRVSFEFDTEQILDRNNEKIVILVSGTYRINRGSDIPDTAFITLDKINKKIRVLGEDINLEQMDITFIEGC